MGRILRLRDVTLDLGRRIYVVGILNLTSDSFYARARHPELDDALTRAHEMAEEGADLLEVGGESARPGPPVPPSEEIRRVVPAIARIREEVRLPVIVETTKFEVAREALRAGAVAINDVSGLADPRLADLAAEFGAGLVIMHRRGLHKIPHPDLRYGDVVAEVRGFLARKAEFARSRGIPRDGILLDPGFSFDKQPHHDVTLLLRLPELLALGYPVYLATSRKNYLRDLLQLPPEELLEATAAAVVLGIERGARVIRTHDVRFMVRIARTMEALLDLAQAVQVDVPAAE
ncbi:MAG: dihydropteroate synthase [Armatimonadetes bacterium]|nr:dihydropteroate synthase [Armatimonadota bacterium]MDW8153674.1 dihydropteroate synthase [Armatimonadota bacterium]